MSGENKWFICNSVTRFQSDALSHSDLRAKCSEIHEEEGANWHIWHQEWPAWKPIVECPEFMALMIKPNAVAPPPMPSIVPPPLPATPPPMPMASIPPLILNPVMPVSLAKPTTEPDYEVTQSVSGSNNFEITQPIASPVLEITQPISLPPPEITEPIAVSRAPVREQTQAVPLPPPPPVEYTQALASAARDNTEEIPVISKLHEERRKHPRYDARLRVIIRNEQITFRTFSVDISLGGISLEQRVPEHVYGQQCQIFIAGPDGRENLRFSLSVTSRNDLKYFSFSNLEDRFVQRLQDWLDDIGPKMPYNPGQKHG